MTKHRSRWYEMSARKHTNMWIIPNYVLNTNSRIHAFSLEGDINRHRQHNPGVMPIPPATKAECSLRYISTNRSTPGLTISNYCTYQHQQKHDKEKIPRESKVACLFPSQHKPCQYFTFCWPYGGNRNRGSWRKDFWILIYMTCKVQSCSEYWVEVVTNQSFPQLRKLISYNQTLLYRKLKSVCSQETFLKEIWRK